MMWMKKMIMLCVDVVGVDWDNGVEGVVVVFVVDLLLVGVVR